MGRRDLPIAGSYGLRRHTRVPPLTTHLRTAEGCAEAVVTLSRSVNGADHGVGSRHQAMPH